MSGRRGRKEGRVSTKDMRMLLQMTGQNRQEEHDKNVKLLDLEMKNISGMNRKLSDSRLSSKDTVSSKDSIDCFPSEITKNEHGLQFVRDNTFITNSVKEKLRKLQSAKKESEKKTKKSKKKFQLSEYKKDYDVWTKFLNRLRINSERNIHSELLNDSTFQSSNNIVISDNIYPGQEHITRGTLCFICGKCENTCSNSIIVSQDGETFHTKCFNSLFT